MNSGQHYNTRLDKSWPITFKQLSKVIIASNTRIANNEEQEDEILPAELLIINDGNNGIIIEEMRI